MSGILQSILGFPPSIYVLLGVAVTLAFGNILARPTFPSTAPKLRNGWPLLGSLDFFRARGLFLRGGDKVATQRGQFSFYYGQYPVVSVSDSSSKATFFSHRGLDMNEGLRKLFATGPEVSRDMMAWFNTTVRRCLRKEKLDACLPLLVRDVHASLITMSSAPKGVIAPFDEMWRLVYQLTQETLGSHDIADDPVQLRRTLGLFSQMDENTGFEIMFPWLPTPKKMIKTIAGIRLYSTLTAMMDERRQTGRRRDDTMQWLLDEQESNHKVSTFIMGAIFAGVINSGVNAGWVLGFLAQDQHWYARFQEQVDAAVTKHQLHEGESPADVFKRLTLEQWELEFPLIDLGLRESIRLNFSGSFMRKNVSGQDIVMGDSGQIIPRDMYAVYLADHTHQDESIFTEPLKWDPGRYLPDRAEHKKSHYGFLGWGVGSHPCIGMRFAKLEICIAVAMFMAYYDFRLCDENGNVGMELPGIDRDRGTGPKMPRGVYMKITPRF